MESRARSEWDSRAGAGRVAPPGPPEAASFEPRFSLGAHVAPAVAILAVTSASLAFFYACGLTNLYGDAIAHMEGARRLTDSLTPGLAEIGSVWLPLYHFLVAPLAANFNLWRTGLGGSLVSAAALGLAAWFIFRLGSAMNRNLAAGWVALVGFLACANMLYIGSTPLTEPLCVMWAALVAWELYRFQQNGRLAILVAAALAAFFGTLTRYDGWYLLPFAALFVLLARPRGWRLRLRDAAWFSVIAGAGPLLWALHNWYRYGNPMEFYNGPYSAQAIYAHQLATTGFRYPTDGSYVLSARYYLEDLKLVIGAGSLVLAVLGLVAWAADAGERARRSAALLTLVPFVFYVQSMAHSSVPIYVPTLFPHTYYNLRYGLEMLPAAALLPSFLVSARLPARVRTGVVAVVMAILAVQFGSRIKAGAVEIGTVKESLLNTPCHTRTAEALIDLLKRSYAGGTILMGMGKYPCVLPTLGIPYRQALTESNRPYWTKLRLGPAGWPPGPPFTSLAWILRTDSDPVDELMRAYPDAFRQFTLVETYRFPGEDTVRVYRREPGPPSGAQESRPEGSE
ncbi:MAG TPA: hypothetical protein VL523_17320 [Terriglobia bacterium]|nr:hypothetical protein [Terriglobia bacterium]